MNIEEYNFKTEPYQHQIDTLKQVQMKICMLCFWRWV